MAEIKWIKLSLAMFDDEKIKLIDSMLERDTIHYIWIRLLIQAGKNNFNGLIFLNESVPYTEEMIATIFSRPIESIRLALNTLCKFGMIEIDDKNFIKITNWEKYQNIEGMNKVREQSRLRMQKMRKKRKVSKEKEDEVTVGYADVAVQNKKEEIEEDKEIDKDINKNIDKESIEILKYYEGITGKIGGVSLGAIKMAILSHGKEYVKSAMDKALEVNIFNMTYVNGILKNWRSNGYPNLNKGDEHGGNREDKKSDKNEFTGFKPQEPRKLNNEERKGAEKDLI